MAARKTPQRDTSAARAAAAIVNARTQRQRDALIELHIPAILDEIAGGATALDAAHARGLDAGQVRRLYPLLASPAWADQHRAAREAQVCVWMDQTISDPHLRAETLAYLPDGRLDPASVQLLRLAVETRRWIAERVAVRVWGHRTDVTSGGERIGGVVLLPPEQPAPSE